MKLTLNVSLAGKTTVAFEHMYTEGKEVAVHADLSVSDGSVQYFHKKSKSRGKRSAMMIKFLLIESSHFHFCDGR